MNKMAMIETVSHKVAGSKPINSIFTPPLYTNISLSSKVVVLLSYMMVEWICGGLKMDEQSISFVVKEGNRFVAN